MYIILNTILYSIIGSGIYAFVFYFKKAQKGEEFDPFKMSSTVIIGMIIGIISIFYGLPITESSVVEQIGFYGMLTVVVENILKSLYRRLTSM